eukprot:CAMPEP_0176480310 /NCGR_PEP_ID=MMETSP0200_2-20121128/2208_1 /TAXON_ID=947934 /ORGANISM="Chaetoceros sp., Strain GSL56" /LENGTH=1290 /DNA_ID=CAMNT_0017876419 /DNA_START=195 /DNA_END=4067 /DNA_ORIENTATION=+
MIILLIPDGQFLRKYLGLLEEIVIYQKQQQQQQQQQHTRNPFSNSKRRNHFIIVLLESAAELMDYRNSSPCIQFSTGEVGNESTAVNERRRISKLWHECHNSRQSYQGDEVVGGISVFPFADLSVVSSSSWSGGDGDQDDFALFNYKDMTITDRSRCALRRAANMLSFEVAPYDKNVGGSKQVIILSDDEFHRQTRISETEDDIRAMNCDAFLTFWTDNYLQTAKSDDDPSIGLFLEHWEKLKQNCLDEYDRRNKVSTSIMDGIGSKIMDPYGHFEYSSQEDLEKGLQTQNLFRSVINVCDDNPKEAYCTVRNSNGADTKYYLNELNGHFNRSIHGDTVVIEPLPRDQWEEPVGKRHLVHVAPLDDHTNPLLRDTTTTRGDVVPTARVVGIHKSSWKRRQFVASMIPYDVMLSRDQNYILVIPMDYKIPRIRIKTRIAHDKLENKRLLVEIDSWDVSSMYPHGHLVQVLGDVGDLNTEIGCLLRERGIDLSPFSANALACLPSVDKGGWKIDQDEIAKRRDLRDTCRIFSVDPVGCQDIDDAMHAKVLQNGDIEIGVHIADVTHFVKHNSALDREAARRATTFYLVDRRFDMLPSLLSSDLCSLHGNTDRLAVSVIWTLSADLDTVKSVWYGRTVIHNTQAMTYEQAHNILNGNDPEGKDYRTPPPLTAGGPVRKANIPELKHDLKILTELARKLRNRRETEGGGVDLSSGDRGSELKFVLDDNGFPVKVMPKKEIEIHHTIAELMILANSFVASTIYKHFPETALLRVHNRANIDSFQYLESLMKASGIRFDGSSNKSLAESLKEAKIKGFGTIQDSLFQSLATRAMTEAQYVCTGAWKGDSGLSHYGLGLDLYTHFTSPIRRYADIVVHHLLLKSKCEGIDKHRCAFPSLAKKDELLKLHSDSISVLKGEGMKASKGMFGNGNYDDVEDSLIDALIEGAEELALGTAEVKDESFSNLIMETDTTALYKTSEMTKICEVLNTQNRLAKLSSMECQRLFLSLYFRKNVEVTQAVIIGLKRNGVAVYVPKYDIHGKVFLSDRDGNVQIDPTLLGLSPSSGLPPSSGFAPLEGCRMFPDGMCSLIDEQDEAKSRLEVYVPNGTSALTFSRLDVITIQLSCDLSDVVARVPPPRIHLVSMDRRHKVKTEHKERMNFSTKQSNKLQRNYREEEASIKMEKQPQSMFEILCSIPIVPNLGNTPLRYDKPRTSKKYINRVQTIKGRLFMNGFRSKDLEADELDSAHVPLDHQSLVNQALTGDYNASKKIEREATARMQRIAAEKRNAKRSKAMKRH